jgi:hypothetical protein
MHLVEAGMAVHCRRRGSGGLVGNIADGVIVLLDQQLSRSGRVSRIRYEQGSPHVPSNLSEAISVFVLVLAQVARGQI